MDNCLPAFREYSRFPRVDPTTRLCRGVAFVRFASQTEATNAMQALNGALGPNKSQKLSIRVRDHVLVIPRIRSGGV